MKPHIVLRYDCPRHNVYTTRDHARARDVYTIHPRDIRLAAAAMQKTHPLV